MLIQELEKGKLLILGFGREGKDTLLFLRKLFPKKIIGIADRNPRVRKQKRKHVRWHLGENYLRAIKNYEVIIRSPGIPTRIVAPFLSKRHILTSETQMFFEECPGTIIGVTGTKGKSTTASLIHAVLRSGGVRADLLGNIGKPVLSYLEKAKPEDVFVYELSSFQLENLSKSPPIAVLLNIYPEHLDHHGSFAKYIWAKANIIRHQTPTDFLMYDAKNKVSAAVAKLSKAQKIPFMPKSIPLPWIASAEPARIVGRLFSIPKKKIELAIKKFKPLEHRLEKIGEWRGITFYNDSLATIPQATIAAIEALHGRVHTLIAGGFDRGLNFETLGRTILKSRIRTIILFPTTGKKILKAMKNPPQTFFAKNMEEAVMLAYQHTLEGKICLLSPASASFNMFKDYQDRGEQFKKFVVHYGKKKNP